MDTSKLGAVEAALSVRPATPPVTTGSKPETESRKVETTPVEYIATGNGPEKKAPESVKREVPMEGFTVRFDIDEEIDRVVVTVVDKETGEIIREIPDEAMRQVAQSLREATGHLLDQLA